MGITWKLVRTATSACGIRGKDYLDLPVQQRGGDLQNPDLRWGSPISCHRHRFGAADGVIFLYSNEGVSLWRTRRTLALPVPEDQGLSWKQPPRLGRKQKRRRNEMKFVQSILTKNPSHTAEGKITVKGLMLHLRWDALKPKASVFITPEQPRPTTAPASMVLLTE